MRPRRDYPSVRMPRAIHLYDPVLDRDTTPLRPPDDGPEHALLPVTDDWISAVRVGTRLRMMPGLFSLHAWGESGLRAAVLSRSDWPVVLHVSRPLGRSAARLIRWLSNHQAVQARAFTPLLRQHAISLGMVASRCTVAEPRCERRHWTASEGRSLRAALGLRETDRVALLPGSEQRGSGHLQALASAVLVHVLEPRLRVLTWGAGPGIDRVRDAARRLGYPRMLVVAADRRPACRFDELLPAADVLLVGDGAAPPLLPIMQALASDVPALLPPTAPLESLRPFSSARFAEDARPRARAWQLEQWLARAPAPDAA